MKKLTVGRVSCVPAKKSPQINDINKIFRQKEQGRNLAANKN
jgi:hypothetical protein